MFRGAFTALITPFRNGEVDTDALTRLVHLQIEAGIHGLIPCGTTGESVVLSLKEHMLVVETTLKAAEGRVPVIAGAGSNDTAKALEVTQACKSAGVAATLQVTPYYNKPPQAGVIAHMQRIADLGLPVILYNVPSRTQFDLHPDSVVTLAEHEMIVGIKEATGNLDRAAQLVERCPETFSLLSGDDFTVLPFMAVGGHGVISVSSNVVPGVFAKLCEAMLEGRLADARVFDRQHKPLTRQQSPNPLPVKAALAHLGLISPELRPPLVPLEPNSPAYARLIATLNTMGVSA